MFYGHLTHLFSGQFIITVPGEGVRMVNANLPSQIKEEAEHSSLV